jgi:transcriptional regulator with GAF, ATPase, and Fis domain
LENEKRNWANEGYTKFSELMRNSNEDINEMAYEIIENLVSYTGAVQGGLFLYNEENKEDTYLELAASTAYNRRKFKQKQIKPGDGLVGACFLEKKKIYITKVPDNYIEVRSGLGTANPDSILIVPLVMEDNVIGIIELAAFKNFSDFEIEFVENVSESIAASLYATRINIRTSHMYKDFEKHDKEKEALLQEIKEKDAEIRTLKRKLSTLEEKKSILTF